MVPGALRLISLFCVVAVTVPSSTSLKIGAFNVRVFGPSKASKDSVMMHLAKIAVRYDILLIQEIRDAKETVVDQLLQLISRDHGVEMRVVISDRLGRTHSKEQYAFLYRADRGISVTDTYHFDDGDEATGEDLFEREPFVVRFRATNCKLKSFTLVALHVAPTRAVSEIKSLMDVYKDVRRRYKSDDMIILGDLNADCAYVPKRDWPNITVRHDARFLWLIDDDVDTTVKDSTDCAYDRFIISGESMKAAILPGSAGTFDFQDKFGLTEQEALEVSDHYPIELTLKNCEPNGGYRVKNSPPSSNASHKHQLMSGLVRGVKRIWKQFVGYFIERHHSGEL